MTPDAKLEEIQERQIADGQQTYLKGLDKVLAYEDRGWLLAHIETLQRGQDSWEKTARLLDSKLGSFVKECASLEGVREAVTELRRKSPNRNHVDKKSWHRLHAESARHEREHPKEP